MLVKSCDLYNFRNFNSITLEFSDGLNFFSGRNGQGKSNFLEALHILSSGRSFRFSKPADLINWNQTEAAIACKINNHISEENLRIIFRNNRQYYYINEQNVKNLSLFIGRLPSVSFNPDDLDLIKGGPEARRNLFDKYVVMLKPSTLRYFRDYQKALKCKNTLLKSRKYSNSEELRMWNKILSENGFTILQLRSELAKKINNLINLIHYDFSGDKNEINLSLSRHYESSEAIFEKYEQLITAEIDRGVTLLGPHRDDIEIILAEKPARLFASQGQARSIVLALKLTLIEILESELNDTPIVLLDDVDSELDSYRSQGFFDTLITKKRQVFITGTQFSEEKTKRNLGAKIFMVESGGIHYK